jgi:crotonobetainyl-CoA:carnitine CoA-transferase CaiB-like acyl-CoA transferase
MSSSASGIGSVGQSGRSGGEAAAPGPLHGVKVVEMGMWVAAPAAAAVLGDWGAEVLKIENPAGGDPVRALMAMGMAPFEPPINPSFELDNRNKRSVTVNPHVPEGRQVLLRLLGDADVFVTNLRAGALERMQLSYGDVRQVNPRIVYASLSGYGTRGPERDRAAFDYAAFWARAGAMASLGEPAGPPPTQRPAMGDHLAGLSLAGAVCAALYHRQRTGEGQELHLSLYQAGLWMMATDIEVCLVTGLGYTPTGRAVPNPLWNHYRARDGRWFHLVMLQADRFWSRFCEAIERSDLATDERYATVLDRAQHSLALIELFDGIFATRTLAEWAERFDRFDLVWGPVQSIVDVVQDPQALALDAFATVPHRTGEEIRVVKSPVEFGSTPARVRHGAPELGEHTEAVLLGPGTRGRTSRR